MEGEVLTEGALVLEEVLLKCSRDFFIVFHARRTASVRLAWKVHERSMRGDEFVTQMQK